MKAADESASNSESSLFNVIRTRWLNFRRKRFWLLCALLLYTLSGFFVVPVIVKNSIIDLLQEDLGRSASLEKVAFNPFVLSLRANDLRLNDKDGVALASFSEFFVNFQLSSLFNWAWTFDEIRLVEPYFFMERFDETDSRLSRILNDFNEARPANEHDAEQAGPEEGLTRLLIHKLRLAEGHIDVRDNLPGEVVETRLAPINISIDGLNTLPDRHGKQSVTIQLPQGSTLKWDGSLTLGPLDSEGELVLENLQLDPAIAYLQSSLPLESLSATLSASFKYKVQMALGGSPEVEVSNINVNVADVAFSGLTPLTEFVNASSISLSGGTLQYPAQTIQFSNLAVDDPGLVAWLDENGRLSLTDLVPAGSEPVNDSSAASAASAWQFGIDNIRITNASLSVSDASVQPAASVDISALNFSMGNFNLKDGTSMPVKLDGTLQQGGSFEMDGALGLLPALSVNARVNTTGLPLALGQPYVQQFANIEIKQGALNSDIQFSLSGDDGFSAGGSIQIHGLEVHDTLSEQRLLGWQLLDIDRFDFDLKGNSLNLSQLTLDQSYSRLAIHEDKTTNLSAIIIEPATDQPASTAPSMDIIIGGILINDSKMDFSDLSLPLPFATRITSLEGSISTIDAGSGAPANIKLEGQVDEFGLARINGGINMFDPVRYTDVQVKFRNLMMSNLSPYTVQFAGREIDQGKLDLDLTYDIKEGLLNGSNNVVLSDLVLGEKIDHPDAASLPLGLAVGLLKDADGVIKVDLPVTGDINDPEFEIGGVVWQAVSGLITKIVSAPFRFLGNLIGVDSEELGQFEFLPGRTDLTPPELEKVAQLEDALQQRPELVIEISGVSDPVLDRAALKRIKLIEVAKARLGDEFGEQDDKNMMLDDEIRSVVETLFVERFPDTDLAAVKTAHTVPPASDPQGAAVLDELAYATGLWEQLLEAEAISDQDLADLAGMRASVIRDAFLVNGKFGEDRLVISAPKTVESEDGEWVKLELGVAAE